MTFNAKICLKPESAPLLVALPNSITFDCVERIQTLCAILYHLYNVKNVKNTHGEVLLLLKLQAKALLYLTLLHEYFYVF